MKSEGEGHLAHAVNGSRFVSKDSSFGDLLSSYSELTLEPLERRMLIRLCCGL